ncbi:hypothetical protein PIB30_047826 [Stylosanthes scabra]|uniref:Uncharacterized protein n=1 Tax=Stylosanthes scabra TaxID=79078 RepID=A0ABU6ZFM8_9FABA|nr:hypothetical protein [Stylosanthes scabra]
MGARREQFLESLVILVQSFPVELSNCRDFFADAIRLRCVFVTTGPSSGGADYFKILNMFNGVLARPTIELRKKVYQTRLQFEICIEFGKSVGLVIKHSACPADLLET